MSTREPGIQETLEKLRRAQSLKWSRYPDTIGAWVAEMDFGIAPEIEMRLIELVTSGRLGYQPDHEVEQLAEATAEWCADRFGWSVSPDQVRRVPDVIHALELVATRLTPGTSKVAFFTPNYMPFFSLPRYLGREVVQIPMAGNPATGWSIDLERLHEALDTGVGLLVLTNPHNPIGKAYSRQELADIAEIVSRHPQVRVYSDEIHAPLMLDNRPHVPYASVSEEAAQHSITAISAGKGWNIAGLKCAQLVFTRRRDVVDWDELGIFPGLGTSPLGVAATISAYRDGRGWLDGIVDQLRRNRALLNELLARTLPKALYREPEATYLAWIDLSAYSLNEDPAKQLLTTAGVALTPGPACGPEGTGFVRYNFATPPAVVAHTIAAIAGAVAA